MAPTLTFADLKALKPCEDRFAVAKKKIGGPRKWNGREVTAAEAHRLGMSVDDLIWVASACADRGNVDVERRLRLWMADCASRVLHIYEKKKASLAPREAILAARAFARGQIGAAARDAAGNAARDAARDAAWAAGFAAWAARDAARVATWAAGFAAGDAAKDATWAAAWDAGDAAKDAAGNAARDAARDAGFAARAAARVAEEEWQKARFLEWFSENEPADWPLPKLKEAA